jgi:hypothetical protein
MSTTRAMKARIEHVIKRLKKDGGLVQRGEHWHWSDADGYAVPPSERGARTMEHVRQLLQRLFEEADAAAPPQTTKEKLALWKHHDGAGRRPHG